MAILNKGQTFSDGEQVTSTKLNALVDGSTFASGAVDDVSTQLSGGAIIVKDGGITEQKLGDDSVTTAKIVDSNVTTSKIADSNVTTAKIADSNVTTSKIADSNVTTSKIANSNVTKEKIENVANMKVLGNTSGSAAAPQEVSVVDDDTMATASATTLATSESIKAYTDGDNSFNTTDGYQKFPGGLIVQFGHRTTDSVSGWTTTNFPTSFTNKCMFVNIIEEGGSSRNFNIRNISTTSFQSEAIGVPSNEARYFAIGY